MIRHIRNVLRPDEVAHLVDLARNIRFVDGRATNPDMHFGVCGEHGGDPKSIKGLFNVADVDYVSCSPYRVPLARLAAAQAKLEAKRNA